VIKRANTESIIECGFATTYKFPHDPVFLLKDELVPEIAGMKIFIYVS
jgi:hypothetical protein